MYTTLLVVHIVGMIASLGLMSGALLLGASGKRISARVASVGMVATAIGGTAGIVLLLSAPLTLKCTILTAYLLGTIAIYKFGFALGDADKARFIRRSAVVQDNE
jgi:hypothetical protein